MAYEQKCFKRIEEVLDKQFPKGDKARGRALVLFGSAMLEVGLAEVRAIRKFEEEHGIEMNIKLKEKLKQKLIKSKDDWIKTLYRELKEEMIDSL